jgi:hypothetical protein
MMHFCKNGCKMEKLFIAGTSLSPEILLSPAENIFYIKGNSMPEDVRAIYYPVTDWIRAFSDELIVGVSSDFTLQNPFILKIDLIYFNSSSAKFLYDIFTELKRLRLSGIPFRIDWYYDIEDPDMKDAGLDISTMSEIEFTYIGVPT